MKKSYILPERQYQKVLRFTSLQNYVLKAVLPLLFFLLSAAFSSFANTIWYYNAANGSAGVNTLADWWSASNYTGSHPANFTTASYTWEFNGSTNLTITANFTPTGTGTLIQVGDATHTVTISINSGVTVSATNNINVANNATLAVAGTAPTFGTLSSGSTVNYNGTGSQTITTAFYYNLTVTNGFRTVTLASSGTITIAGTFTPGTATYIVSGSTIDFDGSSGGQSIPAFTYYNLTSDYATSSNQKTLSGNVGINNNLTLNGGSGAAGYCFVAGTHTTTLNGSATQTINIGSGINSQTFYKLTMNNSSGVNLSGGYIAISDSLIFIKGRINGQNGSNDYDVVINSGAVVSGAGQNSSYSGYVHGKIKKAIASCAGTCTTTQTFEIGDASYYTPVTITFHNVSSSMNTVVSTLDNTLFSYYNTFVNGSELNSTHKVNRFWSIGGTTAASFASADVVLNWKSADDYDFTYDPPYYIAAMKNDTSSGSSNWQYPSSSSPTDTSISITGISSSDLANYSNFQVGLVIPVTSIPSNATICSGGNISFIASYNPSPTPSVQWQVSADGGSTYSDITDGGIYSGSATDTLVITGTTTNDTITGVTTAMNNYRYRAQFINTSDTVNSLSATLYVNAVPSITITDSSNVTCNGCSDGSATVTPSGGTLPYSYLWSPSGGTDSTATGLTAGIYSVTVTGGNGCSSTISSIIGLIVVASGTTSVCETSELDLSAYVPGCPGATFSWSGPNSFASSLQNPVINQPTLAATGVYTVTGTCGALTGTATITVTVYSCDLPCIDSTGGTNRLIINTGYNYLHPSVYPLGAPDPSWNVVVAPGGSVGVNATVENGWSNTLSSSGWIGQGFSKAGGVYEYEFIFNLPVNYTNVVLDMNLLADNVAAVFLNGNELGYTPGYPTVSFTSVDFTIPTHIVDDTCSKFHPGCDTLVVRVINQLNTITGIDVNGSITINGCDTCPVCDSSCYYLTAPAITAQSCFTSPPTSYQIASVPNNTNYSYAWSIIPATGCSGDYVLSSLTTNATSWKMFPACNGELQLCVITTDDSTGCQVATCEIIDAGIGCRLAKPDALNATGVFSKLYPNPSNGMVTLEYQLSNNSGLLQVFDLVGKMVYSTQLDGDKNKFEFDIADLSCGMFEYRVIDGNNVIARDRLVLIK